MIGFVSPLADQRALDSALFHDTLCKLNTKVNSVESRVLVNHSRRKIQPMQSIARLPQFL